MHKGLFSVPAYKGDTLTPSDSAVFSPTYRAMYIGGTGNVTVVPEGQSTPITFWSVPAGTILPITVKQFLATGTTATNVLGLR